MNVLGIMSGTSLGSVDYAVCDIKENGINLRELWSVDYPASLQKQLHTAARGGLNTWELAQIHHDLGRFYAAHAKRGKSKIQLVGVHGQTVFHNPNPKNPATLQLGESAYLVETLRVPVVSNFRVADLAAGGQGAPLATIFHKFVFAKRGEHVCVNNLGGISNVTSLDWTNSRSEPKIRAFDTGPANMLIDFAMRHFTNGKREFDENGSFAAKGKVSETHLKKWLKHPYFSEEPPKSTGRELFGEPFFNKAIATMRNMSQFDVIATFTEFTARSIALNYKLHLPSQPATLILTGGGAANPVLSAAIDRAINSNAKLKTKVISSAELKWPVQSIEPAAFALLAWLRFNGKPGNIPATTGARRPVLCGQVSDM